MPFVVMAVVGFVVIFFTVREVTHSSYVMDVHWGGNSVKLTPSPPSIPVVVEKHR